MSKKVRKRLTYSNVMSSIALFLVLGGATAFAAHKLGKSSVGTKQLKNNSVTTKKIKKNAVTGVKIKAGTITGNKINLATLGKVPSAANADLAQNALSANSAKVAGSVEGRMPFSVFTSEGVHTIATVGPFTIKSECIIDNGVTGEDEGELQLFTSENGAAMDDNNGDEFDEFDISDSPAELYFNSEETGEPEIEIGEEPGLIAIAPNGTGIVTQNESIGFNIAHHQGQCYFAGLVQKVG